jgi:hypothetical protein
VVFAFHGSDPAPGVFRFRLRGLRAGHRYRVHFRDHSSPDRVVDGRELMDAGLAVRLPTPQSSELVVIDGVR